MSEPLTVVLTGATAGIGLEAALQIAAEGHRLVLVGRSPDRLARAAAEVRAVGAAAVDTVVADYESLDSVRAAAKEIRALCPRIDVLVNNAGTVWGDNPEDIPLHGWQKVVDVNLTGVFLCAQAAGRVMIEQRGGKIVNIASVAGLRGGPPEVMNALPYNATKGAVISLTRDLACKWARHGINVNAIAPGWFPSDMANFVLDAHGDRLLEHIPLRRFGGEADLKGAVAFLATRAGDDVTGQTLVVDGGQSAW